MVSIVCRALLAALVLLSVMATLANADRPKIKARVHPSVSSVMNSAKDRLKNVIDVEFVEEGTDQANLEALMAGEVDFLVTPSPARSNSGNAQLMHFPIATGGISIVSSVGMDRTISLSADLLAGIFAGRITRWNDPSFLVHTRELEKEDTAIKVVLWDLERTEIKELRRYLKYNSGGKFKDNVPFTSAKIVGSFQEALEEVKKTRGAITYAPFGSTPGFIPFQFWLDLAGEYVSPFPPKFKNSLMPFKAESDLPKAEDSWETFTLTDMTKMPPDGSCMSMPPYGISRFFYIITKKDQRNSAPLKGAALGAFIRVTTSLPLNSDNLLATIPPPSVIANTKAISRIQYRDGESPDIFLASVPLDEPIPEQMPAMAGTNMNNMPQGSKTSAYITIAFLLSSGLFCVAGYYLFLKYYKSGSLAESATWVPWLLQPSTRGQPKNYEPLPAQH
jgi:ABC-type phosphate transport system substrate-binding protein